MRRAVIVIADLYLRSGESHEEGLPLVGGMPALEYAGRFGERSHLEGGWRRWLARSLGRPDIAEASVAHVAAASLRSGAGTAATRWIATPVELIAGLTSLHLSRRGILRLSPEEQAELIAAFHRTFAGADHLELHALDDGQLLLGTPRIAALETAEAARCAGGDIRVPQGAAAAPLLRLMAEIEMWLHGERINEARRARGLPPVTGLWLWGAGGATPARIANHPATNGREGAPLVAYGSDAWLMGLCAMHGGAALPLPGSARDVLTDPRAECAVLVAEAAGESPQGEDWSLPDAVAAIDRRLVGPALEALKAGMLERLTVIANDTRITVGRHSALRRWRRRRAGFRVFA